MRRRWLTWNEEAFGVLAGDYVRQSWACARDEASGVWTVTDRRSMPGVPLMVDEWTFGSTEELIAFLVDDWPGLDENDILDGVATWPKGVRAEITDALEARNGQPEDVPIVKADSEQPT